MKCIDKRFIIDDINDFLKPNNYQWKTYFDKAECRAILDAIEKSTKYEKIAKAWEKVLTKLEEEINHYELIYDDEYCLGEAGGLERAIDIINQHLAEVEE